jgi:tRNA (guanine-N7-)-methyltransferase
MLFDSSDYRPYSDHFQYNHSNPYFDKLKSFDSFVFRDHECEGLQNNWNQKVFKNNFSINLEIGTGYGHFMIDYSKDHTNVNFVGLDYRFKRSFQLSKKLSKLDKTELNIRYLRAKAERMHYMFGENELSNIFYFFPDPWPKNKHLKKRLFKQNFLEIAYQCLKPGGKIYIKTDHIGYYLWMKKVLSEDKNNLFTTNIDTYNLHADYPEHFLAKYKTKFEKIFLEQKINTKALILTSNKEVK